MLTRRRKRQRVLSVEEKDKLRAQAKAAYEIRIAPTTRVSYWAVVFEINIIGMGKLTIEPSKNKKHKGELLFPTP